MNIKVSIIIPVYNIEKHLKQCLDSVINQSLQEIEIICVNDGSTDNSPQILEEYAQKDDRIIIINKSNEGLAAARNTGMSYAKGEYIGFVDSDDWVELDMYEKLYENAQIYNSEIVMSPMHIFDDTNSKLKYDDPYFTLEHFNEEFDNCTFNHLDTKEFIFKINVTAPNKLYKFQFLENIDANFPEGLVFEDNPFFFYTYLQANKVSLIRDYQYFYRINRPGSIIKKADGKFFDLIKIHELTKNIFVQTNNYEEYEIDLINYSMGSIFSRFRQVDEKYKKDFFNLIKRYLEKLELEENDINKLNPYSKNNYEDFVICDSFCDYKQLKMKEKNNKLQKENILLKKSNETYRNKIKEMESSNSWKITKPMRIFINKIRKVKS